MKIILASVFLLSVLLASFASAQLASNIHVTIDNVELPLDGNSCIVIHAGSSLPIKVDFTANDSENDVRIKAWISGSVESSAFSKIFDISNSMTYSKLLNLKLPSLSHKSNTGILMLRIESESDSGQSYSIPVKLKLAAKDSSSVKIKNLKFCK